MAVFKIGQARGCEPLTSAPRRERARGQSSYAEVDSMAAAVCHIASLDELLITAVPTAEWTISNS